MTSRKKWYCRRSITGAAGSYNIFFELYDQEFAPDNSQEGKLSVYWPIK